MRSLKNLIRYKQALLAQQEEIADELEIPGEPMIYSVKYSIGARMQDARYWRNKKWASILRCWFRSYRWGRQPVVLLVRFYVSPHEHVRVSAENLRLENKPATGSWELCDYLLSAIEMFHHVLTGSYQQFVKIDCEKYYSKNPRTVFKFMHWEAYVKKYQAQDPFQSKAKGKRKTRKGKNLQSERKGDVLSQDQRAEPATDASRLRDVPGPATGGCPLSHGSPEAQQ